jgi:hypothetical protein
MRPDPCDESKGTQTRRDVIREEEDDKANRRKVAKEAVSRQAPAVNG